MRCLCISSVRGGRERRRKEKRDKEGWQKRTRQKRKGGNETETCLQLCDCRGGNPPPKNKSTQAKKAHLNKYVRTISAGFLTHVTGNLSRQKFIRIFRKCLCKRGVSWYPWIWVRGPCISSAVVQETLLVKQKSPTARPSVLATLSQGQKTMEKQGEYCFSKPLAFELKRLILYSNSRFYGQGLLSSEGREWGVGSVVVGFGVLEAPQFSVQRS